MVSILEDRLEVANRLVIVYHKGKFYLFHQSLRDFQKPPLGVIASPDEIGTRQSQKKIASSPAKGEILGMNHMVHTSQ